MPGTYSLGLRAAIAGGIFLMLFALLFTFPAIMAGDVAAFGELIKIGGALSFAILVGVLMIALPIAILFGWVRIDLSNPKLNGALIGLIVGFGIGIFALGADEGDASTADVFAATFIGAALGWYFGGKGRESANE